MEQGGVYDGLEVRRERDGKRRIRGRFPYGKRAVLSAGGNGRRPRKEEIKPGAFSFAIDDPDREIHALVGHSFDRPLASKRAGTLLFNDTREALFFDVILGLEIQQTSWVQDFLAAFQAGLIIGVSPGFRVPPPERVPNAEETEEEDPSEGDALIRILNALVLFELSFVTRPAYPETAVEERDNPALILPEKRLQPAYRWRL